MRAEICCMVWVLGQHKREKDISYSSVYVQFYFPVMKGLIKVPFVTVAMCMLELL